MKRVLVVSACVVMNAMASAIVLSPESCILRGLACRPNCPANICESSIFSCI